MQSNKVTFQIVGVSRKIVFRNLRKIASWLPNTYYKAASYSYKKGELILEDMELSHLHHVVTDPEAMYKLEKEEMHSVKHYKRLKSLLKYGAKAVQKYVTELQQFEKEWTEANGDMPFVVDDMDMWIKAQIVSEFLNPMTKRKKRHHAQTA